MPKLQIDSAAFRKALLESERRRIYGIAAFLSAFAIAIIVRIAVFHSHMSPWGAAFLLLVVAYELWISTTITKVLKTERNLPDALRFFNIVIEIAVPALGIAFFSSPRLAPAYQPIATPWVLAFFPLIMLSVLSLNPRVPRIAGIIAAIAYMASAWYLGWRPTFDLGQYTVTQTAVAFYAAILLVGGFVAALLADEMRRHVEAALREAETQRQLKQVEHDLEIARSIQQSLLPRIRPTINGLEISGWNLPADATGGDYFDWKKLRDGRLVVTLADVTGHGIGPALLASVCRAYARSSFDTHDNMVKAMQHINQFFGEDLTDGRFATFVAAACSEDNGSVELLSAGHGPMFVYSSARDTFDELGAQAIPLGLLPELNSGTPVILNLIAGDILVLATDGFFEWENANGEQFGVQRLTQAIRESRFLPPEEIITDLYNSVRAFANGTKQMDDLTAIVIKRVEAGENS